VTQGDVGVWADERSKVDTVTNSSRWRFVISRGKMRRRGCSSTRFCTLVFGYMRTDWVKVVFSRMKLEETPK
jgi:hypothetical protein